MAAKRDIEIVKGDDYVHVVTIKQRVGTTTTPINITGRTYTAHLRKVKTQTLPDAVLTCTVTDAVNGQITITLANALTGALRVDCYTWDLQQNASGVITTVLAGTAKVKSDSTR